jgi:DNA invertase Pin-like site-specific DNA recombinase
MQQQACNDFALRQGWEIKKEFSEKGISGFKVSAKDRDAIQDIQRAALEVKFDILLVFMFDRLGRRDDETPFIVEWFTQQGIEVWSTQEGQQRFDNHVDKLMNYIRFWQASEESIKTSVRTKVGMGQLVREGHYKGGKVLYGYRLVKNGRMNKRLKEVCDIEINPYEAEHVKIIFEKYVHEGYGIHRIINFLADKNLYNHSGNRFSFSSIRAMIQNVLYIGILKSGETLSDVFPNLQIIDNEIWEQAQMIRIARKREYEDERSRRIPLNTKGEALLSGNIFCSHCGGRMCLTTNVKLYNKVDGEVVRTKRIRYRCYNKTRKICACDGQTEYGMEKLDDIVTRLLFSLFNDIQATPENQIIEKRYQSELVSCTAKLKGAKDALKKHSESLKTLQGEVVNAIQGASKFDSAVLNVLIIQTQEKVAAATNEVQQYELEYGNRKQQMNDIKTQYKKFISWAEIFNTSTKETKKMIAAYLIESVKVRRGYEVDIKFNVAYEQFCIAG